MRVQQLTKFIIFSLHIVLITRGFSTSEGLKNLTHVEVLGVTTGKSSLSDVKAKLGPSEVIQKGDAGKADRYLCYAGSDGTIIKFGTGEGDGTVIQGISIFKDQKTFEGLPQSDIEYVNEYKGYHVNANCGTSKTITKKLFEKFGLQLGMRSEVVDKKLGKKSKEFDGYSIEVPRKPPACPNDHSTVRVWTHFDGAHNLDGVGFYESPFGC